MLRTALCLVLVFSSSVPLSAATVFHDPLFGVQMTPNVQYGTGPTNNGATTANLLLDVYRPQQVATPLPAQSPAIVLIHGGGFHSGDKLDMAPLAQQYTSLGYVVVSINYRMYDDLPPNSSPGPADNFVAPPPGYQTFADLQLGGNAINAAVDDAQAAMDWLHDHAAQYNVDPHRIAVGGVSAGGITSLLLGYNNPGAANRPAAVLDFLGSMYGTENAIQPGGPAAFMFHGDADTVVPFSGDVAVANRLTDVGTYHEFYVGAGVGHELSQNVFNRMYGGKTLLQHNIEFLENHLVPEPASFALAGMAGVGLWVIARRQRRLR